MLVIVIYEKDLYGKIQNLFNSENPDEETTKTLDMRQIIPDLVKVHQYLLNEISTLKEQLVTQSTLISNLQSQINNI